ncbi:MAG: PEP-CTERM sorting domain-containing protein [Planctomycetes bacterium]|nr:PEP-CTERM sorting domain-containing protein [Planctomycetota bacterium]
MRHDLVSQFACVVLGLFLLLGECNPRADAATMQTEPGLFTPAGTLGLTGILDLNVPGVGSGDIQFNGPHFNAVYGSALAPSPSLFVTNLADADAVRDAIRQAIQDYNTANDPDIMGIWNSSWHMDSFAVPYQAGATTFDMVFSYNPPSFGTDADLTNYSREGANIALAFSTNFQSQSEEDAEPAPEPSTMALALIAAAWLAGLAWKRRKRLGTDS